MKLRVIYGYTAENFDNASGWMISEGRLIIYRYEDKPSGGRIQKYLAEFDDWDYVKVVNEEA